MARAAKGFEAREHAHATPLAQQDSGWARHAMCARLATSDHVVLSGATVSQDPPLAVVMAPATEGLLAMGTARVPRIMASSTARPAARLLATKCATAMVHAKMVQTGRVPAGAFPHQIRGIGTERPVRCAQAAFTARTASFPAQAIKVKCALVMVCATKARAEQANVRARVAGPAYVARDLATEARPIHALATARASKTLAPACATNRPRLDTGAGRTVRNATVCTCRPTALSPAHSPQ